MDALQGERLKGLIVHALMRSAEKGSASDRTQSLTILCIAFLARPQPMECLRRSVHSCLAWKGRLDDVPNL